MPTTLNISTNPKTVANWDTISAPQAYVQRPMAAAYVQDAYYTNQPKDSAFKKLLKGVAIVAIAAGALAGARAKIDMFKKIDLSNTAQSFKGMQKVNYYIAKAGQWVIDTAPKLKFWGKAAKDTAKEGAKEGAKEAGKAA